MGRAWWISLVLGFLGASSAWAVEVHDVRLWRAPDHTRIVFDLTGPAQHSLIALSNPNRIVLDIKSTQLRADFARLKLANTPVASIRSAAHDDGDLRVVLQISAPIDPRSFALKANEQAGDRLVLDLYDKQAVQATKVMANDGEKQTIAWIVDGMPVPARILQRDKGQDAIDLRVQTVR